MVSHYGKPTEITAEKFQGCVCCFHIFFFIFVADMHSDGEGNTPQRRGVGGCGRLFLCDARYHVGTTHGALWR